MSRRRSIVRHGAHIKGGTVDITVNGKQVSLREHYPVEEYDDLRQLFIKLTNESPWKDRTAVLHRFVESWEFDGDPHDIAVWGKLDMWSEFAAIESAVGDFIGSRAKYSKNSAKRSTTP